MHVIDILPMVPDPMLGIGYPMAPVEDLIRLAQLRWSGFVPAPGKKNVVFNIEVGSARERILERVLRDKPDLLVIGAHSTEDKARAIGTTAAACAQRAATRVMVVREGQAGPCRSITVCVDFSDTSRSELEQAIRLAAEDGAALHVLHVYRDPWHGLDRPEEVRDVMPDFNEKFERAMQDRLRAFCQPLAHEMSALKAEYHARLARTHAEGIIAFVQRTGCDLVVLGTRGKWNLRDYFWGSTAERVVRDCPCSILAVKPQGFRQETVYQPLADSQAVHATEERGVLPPVGA
jgi:nucleotide-binding universal stress UspA family protein